MKFIELTLHDDTKMLFNTRLIKRVAVAEKSHIPDTYELKMNSVIAMTDDEFYYVQETYHNIMCKLT